MDNVDLIIKGRQLHSACKQYSPEGQIARGSLAKHLEKFQGTKLYCIAD